MKNRQILIVILSVVLIGTGVLSFIFLSGLKKEPPKRPLVENKRFVKAVPVTYTSIETVVSGLGRIASQQEIDLSSEVQGIILETPIPLKKGEQFKKGDVLVRVYDRDRSYNLQARKSRFLNSLANILADLKIDYPESYPVWESYFQSIEMDKPLPKLPDYTSAQEKIFLSSRNILSEYYGIKSDEVWLNKHTLIAPFSGSYTHVFLEIGSVVNPGGRVASIIRTDRLELEVPLETENAPWVKTGDEVQVLSENKKPMGTGRVVRKSNFVDPGTQTLNVFVNFQPYRGLNVYQGQYMWAEFPGIIIENAMEMPRNARFNTNEVYVVQDTLLKKQEINIIKLNEKTLIFNGLEPGSNLVVEPLANAYENMVVGILGEHQMSSR